MSPFSHLSIAHLLWKELLQEGDTAIDATLGTGQDASFLVKELVQKKKGFLYGFDIQYQALEQTKAKLHLSEEEEKRVKLLCTSHEFFPEEILPGKVKLIVYNLGYLPGGDKEITTKLSSTCSSIESAKNLLAPGGALSITCYPGHPEGMRESKAVEQLLQSLPPSWNLTKTYRPFSATSPFLLFAQLR